MNPAQHLLRFAVRLYRWVLSSAKFFVLGPSARCRFTPTCSEYALEAIGRHGAFRGGWFTVKRVCRCHPWGGCGDDPVPASEGKISTPATPAGEAGMRPLVPVTHS